MTILYGEVVFVGRERTRLVGHGGWGFSVGVLGWDGIGRGEGGGMGKGDGNGGVQGGGGEC